MKDVWSPRERTSYHSVEDAYRMQKRAELIVTGNAISESFICGKRLLKKVFGESPASCELEEDFTACIHIMGAFHTSWGRGSAVQLIRVHRDPVFDSAIPNRYGKRWKESIGWNTSTKTLVADHTAEPEI